MSGIFLDTSAMVNSYLQCNKQQNDCHTAIHVQLERRRHAHSSLAASASAVVGLVTPGSPSFLKWITAGPL